MIPLVRSELASLVFGRFAVCSERMCIPWAVPMRSSLVIVTKGTALCLSLYRGLYFLVALYRIGIQIQNIDQRALPTFYYNMAG